MTVTTFTAARRLGSASGWTLTGLGMQRILYLAHMVHLGRHGQPLIDDWFQASCYGPIAAPLHQRTRMFGGYRPVCNVFHGAGDIQDPVKGQLLDRAARTLGRLRAGRLVAWTQCEDGAWAAHYRPSTRSPLISDHAIQREYHTRFNQESRPCGD